MHLKSLEVVGFKSFAKKATLNFTSPITGIVGPNGSGKSNTAEAFRFVLGEQSIKSLRGKRGEDMIWNGGGEGPTGGAGRANRASVKLAFDNSRRMFSAIDFDEVTIERIVHRDNSNEYLLNGTQVRLKDIVELLAAAHVGATGHHIISQGEADRILSASIRERREMIEDALGLKIYQWKKLESVRKLERTAENMKQVESLRREIAPHLRFLKKQVEKVEKAEEMRRELVSIYKMYFAVEEAYIAFEKGRLRAEIAGPRAELSDLDRSLDAARTVLAASKSKDMTSDELISLEKRLASTRIETDAVVRELGRIEGEISANMRAKEKEEGRMKQEEFKTVYLKDIEEVIETIEGLHPIADAKELFKEVIRVLKGFVMRHRSSTDSQFIADIGGELAKLSESKKEFEQRRSSLADHEQKMAVEYAALKHAIEQEKDTNRDAEKEVFRIIARQNEARHIVAALQAEIQRIEHAEIECKRELGEAAIVVGREATQYEKLDGNNVESGDIKRQREEQIERKRQIDRLKIRLEDMGGAGGAEVMKEYKETEERDAFLARELADLEKAGEELRGLISELDTRIDVEFKQGILKINTEFTNYFSLMFGGGHAELSVVKEAKRKKKGDAEELGDLIEGGAHGKPLGEEAALVGDEEGPEGLEVNVSLPRKKVKGLMMLSGGERALTSIALLFAISQVNPPPFIILDETDAALDEANSKKYGDMIENLSRHSQLILITHNRETMSRAGVLYGVTMGADGASKLLSIQFDEAVKVAK
jgi:chromosome segregation ATPase